MIFWFLLIGVILVVVFQFAIRIQDRFDEWERKMNADLEDYLRDKVGL